MPSLGGAWVSCVVTVHGMLEPWAFAHKRWKKRLAWLVYQKAWLNRAFHLLGFRPNINKHRSRFQNTPRRARAGFGSVRQAQAAFQFRLKLHRCRCFAR